MEHAVAYLQFCGISKAFPGVQALQDITFDCHQGSVHALMGENGAGKSTLLKILSGFQRPTSGGIRLGGEEHIFHTTQEALDHGIAIIYQELHLVPEMTVAENIYLGQLPTRHGVINKSRLEHDAARQLARLGMDIAPQTPLKYLSLGQWQMVEIAKALTRDAKVIAFDEPTSSLSTREIAQLFRVIRQLRDEGKVILYVSHRMDEIFDLCDAITVFKDGRYVRTFPTLAGVSRDELVKTMVGRELTDIYDYRPRPLGEWGLEVKDIEGPGVAMPLSFSVRRGEILGIFGLVGAGRSELMKLIFGAERPRAGEICVHGAPVRIRNPIDAIASGIMLCTEDRKALGIIPIHSVQENINISARRRKAWGGFWVNRRWERENAQQRIVEMRVKTPSAQQAVMHLSGGNQQKVILGRWLSEEMKVILLDEPTRGIDVGAKNEIYRVIYNLAAAGIAVVVVSSELPEVLGVADRILVMRDGLIAGTFSHQQATEAGVLTLAMPTR
ncbi:MULTISPECIES: L-arabinose ABC transporter ATP-binding protein AraG [Edwardsiella]|uniref:L-arabinose transport ATP-binding protein AraG n=2 Tax=Edwardsiella anguillarum TaxID=1821960 RepID=A0A076LMV5_9GAMM|nr:MULTISPECIES: L-arabinose ABC transporter ATP-binding protein AraG [Edwardsiella]AKM48095.1 L-arabinose transporter ATP-binding protein [Edwardsiella sp. EA181011]AIJ09830.1 L-arabinose transport ATP-binding protein AraG [Edwardsiella anguillarum ET080813]AKR77515.1 L-arabinose ABC transporter ATP-binding protein AraG [Edwardsiella sp. LADL05-105]KAB0589255.1 L-arabinose ABC transporter ATP-binding protein AraG [Edwardsiella anguillarum]RFT03918.1 L-arabinose ABC transporter ATP-binding pro